MKKTAVVTGASSGLGVEFARLLARDGYDLVLVARSEEKLNALAGELTKEYGVQAHVCAADLASVGAAEGVYSVCQEKGLDVGVLINSAGFGDRAPFAESDWQVQFDMVQVNVVALMHLTRLFLPGMIEKKDGKILNISSLAAFSAGPNMSIYYATKEFVRSFSEAVFEETKGTGVSCTALCPGPVYTGFEKAAGLEGKSRIFTAFKPRRAEKVALGGYRAMMRRRALCYYGIEVKLMNLGSRLLPRCISRLFAKGVN